MKELGPKVAPSAMLSHRLDITDEGDPSAHYIPIGGLLLAVSPCPGWSWTQGSIATFLLGNLMRSLGDQSEGES